MVSVKFTAKLISTTDEYWRWFTIETKPITSDTNQWTNKILVSPWDAGYDIYEKTFDLPPGPNNIWVGVNAYGGQWTFQITVRVAATGDIVANIQDFHPKDWIVNSYTINVPNVTIPSGGGTGTTPFDPSELVKQMVEKLVPPMIQMMGMMMVMQMMAGMMSSMAAAFRGGA
jgi:hypothetical protein